MQVVAAALLWVCAVPVLAEGKSSVPIDVLNYILTKGTPDVEKYLVEALPMSYGDCSSDSPPAPCSGNANLYRKHKSWAYKVLARWISGLKTLKIDPVFANKTAKGITMSIKGMFAQLPVSIYIGECFTFDQCSILWDNTHGCCGSNKHFEVVADVKCGNLTHPIDSLSLSTITLDKIEVTEKIVGIKFDAADLTSTIATAVKGQLVKYLTTDAFLPGKNGTKVTLKDYLNHHLLIEGVFDLLCLKGDATVSRDIVV